MAEGDLLSRYRIDQVFRGEGAVRSYRATALDGTGVCIKVVEAGDAEARAAVERLGALVSLEHPNVARVLDRGLVEGGYAVVREWVTGTHLGTKPLPTGATTASAAGYVADAAEGLAAVHSRGIVHGDIRPSNLVADARGQVKLVDVGVPPAAGRVAVAGAPASDVSYTSPEELDGAQPTKSSDIYSLGAVLYELETGRPPFDGPDAMEVAQAHRSRMPVPPSSLNPAVSPAIDGVTLRALEKLPASRYATATEMASALGSNQSAAPPAGGKRWIWAVVAAAVVALVIIVAVLANQGTSVVVPNVVGMPQAEATTALEAAGLKVGKVTQDPAAEAEPGMVVSQNPAAEAKTNEGGAVDIVIAAVPLVEVPDVVGLDQAAAKKALEDVGLAVGEVTQKQTADAEPGMVLEQAPAAATQANQGTTVDFVVAAAALVKVPNVVGQTQADAKATLEAAGLKVGEVTEKESTSVAPGVVSKQSPDAGSNVDGGSAVTLEVGAAPQVPQVKVPKVTGLTESDAAIELARVGLAVGDVQYVSDPVVAAGHVKSQDPAQGASLPAGSKVALVVSEGTQTGTVPNVVGLTEADATGALEAGGFAVKVSRVASADVEPGLVASQAPAAGDQAASGSAVTIEVSKGSSETAKSVVPDVVGLDVPAALKALSDAKLKPTFEFVTSDQLLLVIEQDPVAGTEVDPGTTVLVVVGVPASQAVAQ
jgi:beta-lactam-binding protein with PASTA domain